MTQEKLGNLTVLNSHKERTAKFAHHAPHFKKGGHRSPHAKNLLCGPWAAKVIPDFTNYASSTIQGGKTFCASFCASLIVGSRQAFDCVCLLLEF